MSLELGLSLLSLILIVIFAPIALYAMIEVKALKSSTHQIQFIPAAQSDGEVKEFVKGIQKMHSVEDEFGEII